MLLIYIAGQRLVWTKPVITVIGGGFSGVGGLWSAQPWQERRASETELSIIVELILIVLVFCAASADAFWPYVIFPAYLGVLSLKITPVGKKINNRLLLFLLAIGLESHWQGILCSIR